MIQPNIEKAKQLVLTVMEGRRYQGLRIVNVEFVYFPSAYIFSLEWDEKKEKVTLPSELVDEALSGGDAFVRRKIKKRIKQAFGHDDED